MEDLNEWKTALENAVQLAPSATHVAGQNGLPNSEQADVANGSTDQRMLSVLLFCILRPSVALIKALHREVSDFSPCKISAIIVLVSLSSEYVSYSLSIFFPEKDKTPITSMVIGRPILLALEDIDGSPSFLEKALRFIEDHGKLYQ